MKKSISMLFAALFLCAALSVPAAAEPAPGKDSCYYPISVEEYTAADSGEPRIDKVYQLSLDDDPGGIPTEDFTRGGRLYYLLDMTKKDEVGVDTKPYVHTVTQASDTNSMEAILQRLGAEMEVTTEDGYTGTLHLDHTTVQVAAKGYATKTGTVSASRTYPNLSEADTALIPKTIEDKGKTLTLADVQWSDSAQTDGEGDPAVRYTATAKYTGATSSKYATGYTVSANYTGEVAKTDCAVVTYTATFGSTEAPDAPEAPDGSGTEVPDTPKAPFNIAGLKRPLMIAGLVAVVAAGGIFVLKKIRERR